MKKVICNPTDDVIIVDEFFKNSIIRLSYTGMMRYAELCGIDIYAFVKESGSDPLYPTFIPFHGENQNCDPEYFVSPHPAASWEDYFERSINSRFSYKDCGEMVSPIDSNVIKVIEELGISSGGFGTKLKVYKKAKDGKYYCEL